MFQPNKRFPEPGHSYLLFPFEKSVGKDEESSPQQLDFVYMDENGKYRQGTTSEDVLGVLIDRTEYLNSKFPCKENLDALAAMRIALEAFENRTKDRENRGCRRQASGLI